jgi:hypothetical protein
VAFGPIALSYHRNYHYKVGAWLDCVTIVRIMAKLRQLATDCFNLTLSRRISASFGAIRLSVMNASTNPLHGKKD